MVAVEGFEPPVFTSWVERFKCPASQPTAPHGHFSKFSQCLLMKPLSRLDPPPTGVHMAASRNGFCETNAGRCPLWWRIDAIRPTTCLIPCGNILGGDIAADCQRKSSNNLAILDTQHAVIFFVLFGDDKSTRHDVFCRVLVVHTDPNVYVLRLGVVLLHVVHASLNQLSLDATPTVLG